MVKHAPALVLAFTLVASCGSGPGPAHAAGEAPPATRMIDAASDYGGVTVEDPYRWLEDQDSEEVLAWADQQNAHTEAWLAQSTARDALRTRLTELWDHPRFGPPSRHGALWIWSCNDGLQNQAVIYGADAPAAAGRVLLDPNTFSSDGAVALAGLAPSHDGRYVAYATATSGSDWNEWRVLEVASRRTLDDRLEWIKFAGVAWTHDGAGFYYQRYDAPAQGAVHEAATRAPKLCYHRLGTAQHDDALVYERPDQPTWAFRTEVTDDGRWAVLTITDGSDQRRRIAYIDLAKREAGVLPLLMEFDASYTFVGNAGTRWFFVTDLAAPQNRVVAVDIAGPPAERLTEIIGPHHDKLESVGLFGGQLVALYLHDAKHELRRFTLAGKEIPAVALPAPGSVAQLTGRPDDARVFFSFSSFTHAPAVYALDLAANRLDVLRAPTARFDAARFVTKQVSFHGADGTRLLLYLVHRDDLRLDGSTPTYLFGYGGFNIALTPQFSVPNLVWVERGGLYAQATLRGGGEFGTTWHEAGMLARKQNVFDDFIACAQYLVRNGYTSPAKLAIGGRSNGGLLAAATLNQHPEMFGAAIPEVGVLDMLRYHEFTIGWAWAAEYGRSDDATMFPVLRAYSPLHNIRDDVAYPPTLIMTGDHDDRVLPGHSYKFAAALQQAQPDATILLRVQLRSGHGAGKPVRMLIEEAADRWAFLLRALDAE